MTTSNDCHQLVRKYMTHTHAHTHIRTLHTLRRIFQYLSSNHSMEWLQALSSWVGTARKQLERTYVQLSLNCLMMLLIFSNLFWSLCRRFTAWAITCYEPKGGGRVGSWGRECHRACVGECLCWCELCRCKQMEGESGQVLTVSACVHVHARGMASANTSRQCHSPRHEAHQKSSSLKQKHFICFQNDSKVVKIGLQLLDIRNQSIHNGRPCLRGRSMGSEREG